MNALPRAMTLLLSGGLLLANGPMASTQPNCEAVETVTDFGRRVPYGRTLSTDFDSADPIETEPVQEASWYKAQIEIEKDDPRPWRLTVRDADNHLLANLTAKDFRTSSGRRWTGIVPRGSYLWLEGPKDSTTRLTVTQLVIYPQAAGDLRYFSTQADTPNWTGLHRTGEGYTQQVTAPTPQRVGVAVGMIVGGSPLAGGGYAEWCCTGVMVSETVMLTNWHCGAGRGVEKPWNQLVCPNMVVDLARDDRAGVRQQYACDAVIGGDPGLDYALIRLKPVVGGSISTGAPVHVSLASETQAVAAGKGFVVHHAQCKPKLLSEKNCRIELPNAQNKAQPNEIAHTCDTEPGASGAPMFNPDGRLVALHHRGFQRNAGCEAETRYNYAIPVSRIIADLKSRYPAEAGELGL